MAEILSLLFDKPHGAFLRWKVKNRSRILRGTDLFLYKVNDGPVQRFKSQHVGAIKTLVEFSEGDVLHEGDVVAFITGCEHAIVMKDMCADCGKDLRKKDGLPGEREVDAIAKVALLHSLPELMVTQEEAEKIGAHDDERLVQNRKLHLLVDLDQTLIHTTTDQIPCDQREKYLVEKPFEIYKDSIVPNLFHFRMDNVWYHTRLRPKTLDFLQTASQYFQLHICTFGVRLYAHTIAKMLDPKGTLFGQRILSRDECFDPYAKTANLKALFPHGTRMVCIIDDREDVWHFSPNVVHVKPYRYFKHTGDINAPPGFSKDDEPDMEDEYPRVDAPPDFGEGPNVTLESSKAAQSMTATDTVEASVNSAVAAKKNGKNGGSMIKLVEDTDDYLEHLENILCRIHKAFYAMYDRANKEVLPDLQAVVPYVKRKVLRGVNLVFTAVIPTNVDINKCHIFNQAKAFGANVHDNIIPPGKEKHVKQASKKDEPGYTTHVVAGKWGTSKVHQAVRSRMKIVAPQWLFNCFERWTKVDEQRFLLTKDNATELLPPEDEPPMDKSKIKGSPGKMKSPKHETDEDATDACDPALNSRMPFQDYTEEVTPVSKLFTGEGRYEFGTMDIPFLKYSTSQSMQDEVTEEIGDEEDECDDNEQSPNDTQPFEIADDEGQSHSSSEEELNDGDIPRGWKRKSPDLELDQTLPDFEGNKSKRLKRNPEDSGSSVSSRESAPSSISLDDDDSVGSVDQAFADALEKELES